MKRIRDLITALIITLAFPAAVYAGEAEHIAVEAMREVWIIEEGTLAEDATQEKLDAAVALIEDVDNYDVFKDLHKIKAAARAELNKPTPTPEPATTSLGSCRITFYCPCSTCCGTWGNATASGATPTPGWTVANGALPFGTKVIIDGHTYCVEDRGVGADQFDIFVSSHSEALARGLYYTEVQIVD